MVKKARRFSSTLSKLNPQKKSQLGHATVPTRPMAGRGSVSDGALAIAHRRWESVRILRVLKKKCGRVVNGQLALHETIELT